MSKFPDTYTHDVERTKRMRKLYLLAQSEDPKVTNSTLNKIVDTLLRENPATLERDFEGIDDKAQTNFIKEYLTQAKIIDQVGRSIFAHNALEAELSLSRTGVSGDNLLSIEEALAYDDLIIEKGLRKVMTQIGMEVDIDLMLRATLKVKADLAGERTSPTTVTELDLSSPKDHTSEIDELAEYIKPMTRDEWNQVTRAFYHDLGPPDAADTAKPKTKKEFENTIHGFDATQLDSFLRITREKTIIQSVEKMNDHQWKEVVQSMDSLLGKIPSAIGERKSKPRDISAVVNTLPPEQLEILSKVAFTATHEPSRKKPIHRETGHDHSKGRTPSV